jgi:hypothetical protein
VRTRRGAHGEVVVYNEAGQTDFGLLQQQGGRFQKHRTVNAGGRTIVLSNLDKQLYPCGFTKGEVINYYSHIAPLLPPHLCGRPVTVIRFPDGVGGQAFFQTRTRTW